MGVQTDLAYGLRRLLRSPDFTIVAVLTLALGIGAETALVTIIDVAAPPATGAVANDVYLLSRISPLPLGVSLDPSELPIGLFERLAGVHPDLVRAVTAEGQTETAIVQAGSHADLLSVLPVTADFGRVFGITPRLGSWFSEGDDRAHLPVAVISDDLWRRWFNAQPGILGQVRVRVNRRALTVVAVAPAGKARRADIWIPSQSWPVLASPFPEPIRKAFAQRQHYGRIYVRLAQDSPPARLDRQVADLVTSSAGFGEPRLRVDVQSVAALQPADLRSTRLRGWLLAFSSLILLGACANLANLVYARGLAREGEVAVRLSLGGSRWRIARLFVAEAALIATASTAIGGVLAAAAVRLFGEAVPALPAAAVRRGMELSPDTYAFAVALAAGTVGALAVGLLAASAGAPQRRACGPWQRPANPVAHRGQTV